MGSLTSSSGWGWGRGGRVKRKKNGTSTGIQMGPSAPLENCAAVAPSSQMVRLWAKAGFSKKAAPRDFTALTACPCKMTTLIAWQMVLGLGRRAPSRALWFGKALQTSRARGCHHHPLPGSSHRETRFHFLPTFPDGGGGSGLFGPPGP